MATIDERRAEILAKIPPLYSGWLHLVFINATALAAIGIFVWLLEDPSPAQIALVPGAFVFANILEWWVHKGPLHHKTRLLGILYARHTRAHHVVFSDQRMSIQSGRELMLVLFPPYVLPILLIMTAPVAVGLWLLEPNLCWLFQGSTMAYYLLYEWLHLLHHMPAESWIGRRALVRWLRTPHWRHHDPKVMTKGNFNVSFPLADWLLGSRIPETK